MSTNWVLWLATPGIVPWMLGKRQGFYPSWLLSKMRKLRLLRVVGGRQRNTQGGCHATANKQQFTIGRDFLLWVPLPISAGLSSILHEESMKNLFVLWHVI